MATYAGFAPGNYNAWALNLLSDVFCTPGVGRGLAVSAPGGMSVTVGVDAVAGDGVVVLPNGGWLRIDQAVTFTVSANSTGSTRNDAIVAFLDPTGVANPVYSLTYTTNWAGGFTGNNNNQWVIATVAVPNGAVSIALANITTNPRVASFGGNKLLDPGTAQGIQVTDLTAAAQTYIQSTVSTPSYRAMVLQARDSAGVGHNFVFDQNGAATIPAGIFYGNAEAGAQALITHDPANHINTYWTPSAGASDQAHFFVTWHSAAQQYLFEIGGAYLNPKTFLDTAGNLAFSPNSNGIIFDGYLLNGATNNYQVYINTANPGGNNGTVDAHFGNKTGGWIYMSMISGTAHIGSYGDVWDEAGRVSATGPHSNQATQVLVSMGSGTPSSLLPNEVYFQIS